MGRSDGDGWSKSLRVIRFMLVGRRSDFLTSGAVGGVACILAYWHASDTPKAMEFRGTERSRDGEDLSGHQWCISLWDFPAFRVAKHSVIGWDSWSGEAVLDLHGSLLTMGKGRGGWSRAVILEN